MEATIARAKVVTLEQYRTRRRPDQSGEPEGRTRRGSDGDPLFVIQKHDATSLHYDFRLEIDGVLKSWAVPKGPSTDPRDKQLAVATDDHPIDYADFEGVIPGGEYGSGTVLIWDRGTYRNLKFDANNQPIGMSQAYADGHLTVWLEGEKLRGGYALTHFRREAGKAQWLLVKMNDHAADARRNPVSTEPASVTSGRSMTQIADEERTND